MESFVLRQLTRMELTDHYICHSFLEKTVLEKPIEWFSQDVETIYATSYT